MKFHYINSTNEVIFSNITNNCTKCYDDCNSQITTQVCPINNLKARFGKITTKRGITFLCSDEIKTIKLFRDRLSIFDSTLIPLEKLKAEIKTQISEEEKKRTKRLLHNLISLNAHNIQELYALVPQDLLTANIENQISIITDAIYENPKEAALTYLRIAKHNIAMKTEFSVFKKLYENNPVLEFSYHPIRKVIFNILHTYFQDFTDKHVYVRVKENYTKVNIDYDSVHVAIYHLIDNASKYCLPNREILIDFIESENTLIVRFDMISIKIDDDEVDKIFNESYSGRNSQKINKSGDGIGMFRAKSLLELNNVSIEVKRDYQKIERFNGTDYGRNIFELKFKKTKPAANML